MIPGKPAVSQDMFFGLRFCGRRASWDFSTSVRPQPTNTTGQYKCPTNYEPCSNATTAENTICVASNADKNMTCPITDIAFINSAQFSTFVNDTRWKVLRVNQFNSLAFSKNVTDRLPLT